MVARAVVAHRAYIASLALWERAFHAASPPASATATISKDEHLSLCARAEAEKERKRIAFRDLCDALGYVPIDCAIAIPTRQCRSPGDPS